MPSFASVHFESIQDQADALRRIVKFIEEGSTKPSVVQAARAITAGCDARDDLCELEAIFQAVKYGTSDVPALANGLRYVADPRSMDFYTKADAMLRDCAAGSCAEDCDGAAILVGALAAAVGFKCGARAWGPGRDKSGEYVHVYCVAAVPKRGPWRQDYAGHGLDTTVKQSFVGWEPKGGHILTAWMPD